MNEFDSSRVDEVLNSAARCAKVHTGILDEFNAKGVHLSSVLTEDTEEEICIHAIAKYFDKEVKFGKRVTYYVHIKDDSSLIHVPDEVIISLVREFHDTRKEIMVKELKSVTSLKSLFILNELFDKDNCTINIQRGGENIIGKTIEAFDQHASMLRIIRNSAQDLITDIVTDHREELLDGNESLKEKLKKDIEKEILELHLISTHTLQLMAKVLSSILHIDSTELYNNKDFIILGVLSSVRFK